MPALHVLGPAQFRGVSLPHHPAPLDDVVTVGDPGQRVDVLVDEEDGQTVRLEVLEAAPDLGSDQWGEPLGRLIQESAGGDW